MPGTFDESGENLGRTAADGDLTDDELIAMFARGDTDAFDVIFDRHHVAVHNFAFHMLGRAADAEEIMQETFVAVARAASGYRPRGRFRSWIMQIARNRSLNRLNAERARREALAEGGIVFLDRAATAPPPDDRMASDETAGALKGALARLPERQREVILLYAFQGMQYREIATTLDIPVGTVKTLLHRARAALARALEDRERDVGDDAKEGHRAV